MSMKNPMTPSGIEPAAFRFVAQHLNHCVTAVSVYIYIVYTYTHTYIYADAEVCHVMLCYVMLCYSCTYGTIFIT